MSIKRRLDRLMAAERPTRLIIQHMDTDGTPRYTEEEIEAKADALRAAGYEPRHVIVETVNVPPPR